MQAKLSHHILKLHACEVKYSFQEKENGKIILQIENYYRVVEISSLINEKHSLQINNILETY